jgi:hypothetical protein
MLQCLQCHAEIPPGRVCWSVSSNLAGQAFPSPLCPSCKRRIPPPVPVVPLGQLSARRVRITVVLRKRLARWVGVCLARLDALKGGPP